MANMDPRDKELYLWVYDALVEEFGDLRVESLSDDFGQLLFFKVWRSVDDDSGPKVVVKDYTRFSAASMDEADRRDWLRRQMQWVKATLAAPLPPPTQF